MNKPCLPESLVSDLTRLIAEARTRAAVAVNHELSLLYWQVGKRLYQETLQGKRAEYGKQVLPLLSAKLTHKFGRGWGVRNLSYMVRFYEAFPDEGILQTLCAKLSWSHFRYLIAIDEPLKRDFYTQMSSLENWSTRVLQQRIDSMLFERTALSKKPEETIAYDLEKIQADQRLTPEFILKDPYLLDFLNLTALPDKGLLEQKLHQAIVNARQRFIEGDIEPFKKHGELP